MTKGRRYHPPSEDFAETKAKLRWAELRIEELVSQNERLKVEVEQKDEMIADILDDTGKEIAELTADNQSW